MDNRDFEVKLRLRISHSAHKPIGWRHGTLERGFAIFDSRKELNLQVRTGFSHSSTSEYDQEIMFITPRERLSIMTKGFAARAIP